MGLETSITSTLLSAIEFEYNELEKSNVDCIYLDILSLNAQERLNPQGGTDPALWFKSVMALRKMARTVCKRKMSQQSKQRRGQLQRRYFCLRNGRDCYVLLSHLTHIELQQVIERRDKEACAKRAHAIDLREYAIERIKQVLVDAPARDCCMFH